MRRSTYEWVVRVRWALRVAKLGDWPTLRRGYARDPAGGPGVSTKVEFDAESSLEPPSVLAEGLAAGR